MLYTYTANLFAVDTTDDSIISDYYYSGTEGAKINLTTNWRFYINALIDTKYYKKFINISKTHSALKSGTFGVYNLTASFENSSVSITRSYNVTTSNFFNLLLKCFNKNFIIYLNEKMNIFIYIVGIQKQCLTEL